MTPTCEHCWPTERRSHIPLHVEYYTWKFLSPIQKITNVVWKNQNAGSIQIAGYFLDLLSKFGLVRFESDPDESKLLNRSLIFLHQARGRGLDVRAVKVINNYPHEFRLIHRGKRYDYQGTPLNLLGQDDRVDEKDNVKHLLDQHGIPVPSGRSFFRTAPAAAYAESLGYPLIVKPNSGSLSHHATYPINTREELLRAIRIARQYQPEFIIERFLHGSLHRVSILGKREVFACRKEPASIIGNGVSTIKELITKKNAHPERGGTHVKNTTLHIIPIDYMLERNLHNQGLSLSIIPIAGKCIQLQKKCVLSHGCDIVSCTHSIHPTNKDLCLKIARLFDTQIIGIDLICEDIALPHWEQSFGIIETNSLPYVDMHAVPSHGEPDPVAEKAWDIVLERLNTVS